MVPINKKRRAGWSRGAECRICRILPGCGGSDVGERHEPVFQQVWSDTHPSPGPAISAAPTTSPIPPVYCPILTSTSLSMAFMPQTPPTAPPDIHSPLTSDTQPPCSTLSLSSLQVRNELRNFLCGTCTKDPSPRKLQLQTICFHFTPDEDPRAASPRPSPPSGGPLSGPSPVCISTQNRSGRRHHLPPGQITVSPEEVWKHCEDHVLWFLQCL